MAAGSANKMLNTKFNIYTDGETLKVGTMAYSVPDDLTDAIDLISPTTYFSSMEPHRAVPNTSPSKIERTPEKRQLSSACQTKTVTIPISSNQTESFGVIGPSCFKYLYNVGDYQADPSGGSSVAFGSFLNQSASYSDLAKFEKIFNIPSQNFTTTLINGGVDDQDPATEQDGEANLDVQNIIGIVDGLPVSEYITGGSPPFIPDLLSPNQSVNQNEPYLQYYNYLLSQPNKNLPWVITNSYGDHEDTVPERYAKRVCNQIGMMGLRGRTILESSGDEGTGAVCRSNRAGHKVQFTPIFPATCPYITSVGGTQFLDPENAWNASSGGFSFYFPTAWYQEDAVKTYLSQYISAETKEYYSSNGYVDFKGRGFPDVAAHSLYPE
jgi:tripeptidyl-peptidase-1